MNHPARTFKIDRGIGQYNASDYFAVLGLPVTADTAQIRKRYLSIARNLHPDVYGRAPEEKHRACEYLAKLVSPAYNMLMQDRERAEYSALLKLIAKRLMKRELKMTPKSDIARNLLYSPSESHYVKSVEAIARLQYESLDKVMEYTAQLSELNLIYIMYQEGYHPSLLESPQGASHPTSATKPTNLVNSPSVATKPASRPTSPTNPSSISSSITPPPSSNHQYPREPQPVHSQNQSSYRVQSYLQQAEDFISKNQWTMALGELRAALQLDNTNSRCHALLGLVYLNQNLMGMAKVSFQQALKINPREALALKHISKCVRAPTNVQSTHKKSSGFFGWLGGS